MLHLIDRNDPVTDMVGKRVVEFGTSGVTDPQEIAVIVVKSFGKL
jgi:hypothetical protein